MTSAFSFPVKNIFSILFYVASSIFNFTEIRICGNIVCANATVGKLNKMKEFCQLRHLTLNLFQKQFSHHHYHLE